MNKDEHYLRSRFLDLANTAFHRNIYTYTDFLNINEINILKYMENQLPPVDIRLTGGNNYAERKIAIFSPSDIYYETTVPISIIRIAPKNSKYSDTLTHRDYLGAILNLGITRNKIGDIFILQGEAYVYCITDIAEYICENLTKIKHTFIIIKIVDIPDFSVKPSLKNITGTISNIRLDSLISVAFQTSRNSIVSLIEGGKVFVNGRLVTSNGYSVKKDDIISVRGKGRFIYNGILKNTKKGRNLVSLDLYL